MKLSPLPPRRSVTLRSKVLGQENALNTRPPFDLAEYAITVAFVEIRRLEIGRIEQHGAAAAFPALLFGHAQHAPAQSQAAQIRWQCEEVYEEKTQRGATGQATDNGVRPGITNDN